jgi:hypothetical protein
VPATLPVESKKIPGKNKENKKIKKNKKNFKNVAETTYFLKR